MSSLYLRMGGGMEHLVSQLEGIGSSLSIPTKDGRITSLADGLAKPIQNTGMYVMFMDSISCCW